MNNISLGLPESVMLNKFLPKQRFYDHGDLSPAQRRIFTDDIEKIEIIAQITTQKSNVPAYGDNVREYSEIAVIGVRLRSSKHAETIGKIVMSAIPYPSLLVMMYNNSSAFFVAHHRANLADKNRDVLENLYFSDFLEDSSPVAEELSYSKQNHGNMFLLYSSMVNAIVDFCLAKRNIATTENKVETLEKIKMLENEITQLRGRLNQAKEFHEKMEINVEIKKIEEMIAQWEDNHE